ncbi:MAG: ABC transporter permease [Defluviitaleaceae bacterium]|nr:ABC transporter permease [Defluviitaleaceae bacterium]
MKLSVNKWRVFAAKEFVENLRTKKLLVLICVFVFLALLSVVTARFMVEIFTAVLGAGDSPITIVIPDPVWSDSYAQLYSNLTEMGMIAFIMLFMGAILREKSTGTIDLMQAKGLTPAIFVLSKFMVAAAIAVFALLIAVFVTYVYTLILFEYGGNIGNVLLGAVPFGVFMLMMLAITLMWSAIAKSTAICAVLGLVSYFILIPIGMIPRIGQYMPGELLGHGVFLSTGAGTENMWVHILIAGFIMVAALIITINVLRKREG